MLKHLSHIAKSFFFVVALSIISLVDASPIAAQSAVPIRAHGSVAPAAGSVSQIKGSFYIQSETTGLGALLPGSAHTADSYFFQCKSAGTAACSTEWNSDAVLINPIFRDPFIVPQLGLKTSTNVHQTTLPYGQCGRVQFDIGVVGIDGAIGGWVHDFGNNCETEPINLCTIQMPINTQFRKAGDSSWVSGSEIGTLATDSKIDINCFAKNGTALLQSGNIRITSPDGKSVVYDRASLNNYSLTAVGTYSFSCYMASDLTCNNIDKVKVAAKPEPTPVPTPEPTPVPTHESRCEDLTLVSGNDSLVPATVTFRARGYDSAGSIQRYKFYFGDGSQIESDSAEVSHKYEVSGYFSTRADVKDSKSNWKSSSSCERVVTVKPAVIESHKSACSDVFISTDNGGQAPATVSFKVTGYDNKNNLQGYKLDFGNGIVRENTDQNFQYRYETPGTYTIRAYIKDSTNQYKGGEEYCKRTLYISTKPITRQPSTGTPTLFTTIAMMSGALAVGGFWLKKHRLES